MSQLVDALVNPIAGPGLELRQLPVPEPGPGEVLIKIHKTAICGTDVHIYNWDPWAQEHIKPPMVIGHEYVGEVAGLGAGVTGLHIGQRVSGEGHITCGRCRNCHTGNIQWCKDTKGVGVDRDGAFAEYVCIPESNVIIIDESLPEDVVAFFDAFGNAAHTALMWDLVGEDVLITGAGPIGIIAAGICKYAGARRVVITDVNAYRLELARKMGADAAVNVQSEDLPAVMQKQGLVEIITHAARIFMPLAELVDMEQERARLDKEIGKAQKELAGLKGKLSNENFVNKAPANVVAAERERLEKLEALLEKLTAQRERR